MSYTIDFEEDPKILICRMHGFLTEREARSFAMDLRAAIAAARGRRDILRVLFDNREGGVVAPAAAAALVEQMRSLKKPGDRSAIIVPNSLSKMQAKRTASTEHEIFLSENAARTWLSAA